MGNILIAEAMAAQATGLFSQGFVWAVLFGLLLVAVVAYAICRWVVSRERKRLEEELQKTQLPHLCGNCVFCSSILLQKKQFLCKTIVFQVLFHQN